ncbi:MAG: SLBB domain-containing protein [Prevotellaceae bacterium]|nr:SLBB domain-containing protein [Prevotellaceae bacterium]
MTKRFLITVLFCSFSLLMSYSQISMQNVATVKVDELSDQQIQAFVKKYTSAGYTFADVENIAKGKGMPVSELEKLRQRVQSAQNTQTEDASINAGREADIKMSQVEKASLEEEKKESRESVSVFGSHLFNNKNMTFEPNMNQATPRNYQIGPEDELVVDVFGMSENTMKLKVSPEGMIRIPNVGQVSVGGMTIENAEKMIRKQLSSIYSTINSGQTRVAVSLGNIRSIKVFIIGEAQRPGTYTLSSLSSLFNALYACGGPSNATGSMRNIKVMRGGKEVAVADLYGFLLKGKMENNITLQDQDVVYIPTYTNRVSVKGALKHNGIFEMKDGESLSDLISFCGGFTDDAYMDRISVVRNSENEKSVADIPKELYPMFIPKSGDEFTIGKILDRYSNRVQILGGVFRPGTYALTDGMTLKDLVNKADGLRENAYMQRASILRLKEDLTPELVSFSVSDLIDGKYNIELKKEDIVTIGSNEEFERDKQVSIAGQVLAPGTFPYSENMTLKDLIFMAKGFTEFAAMDRIEVTRRVLDGDKLKEDSEKVQVFSLSVDKDLNSDGEDFMLQPKDVVSVRTLEGLEDLSSMQVLGEVRLPGTYAIISKKEKISDVMKRAGGFSPYAYPKGAFLIRRSQRSTAEQMRDLKLIELLSNMTEGDDKDELRKSLLSRTDMVGIELKEIVDNPGSTTDLYLEKGDIIFVPKQLQTVSVSGAVQVPGMVVYSGRSFKKYVNYAGGFADNADKKHSYVAYANGSIGATKRFLWMRAYPKMEPGAHVFVPEKKKEESHTKENLSFFTSIFGTMVTITTSIVSLIIILDK